MIARELMKLCRLRILDLVTYKQTVDVKKARTKLSKEPQTNYKDECRKQKRRNSTLSKQNNSLRKKAKMLKPILKRITELESENEQQKKTIAELKATIVHLREGKFDIELSGKSQEGMEVIMQQFSAVPELAAKMREEMKTQDSTGTLSLFWTEQRKRLSIPNKRQRWNPIVLRYVLALNHLYIRP